jgi:hypothetical protein
MLALFGHKIRDPKFAANMSFILELSASEVQGLLEDKKKSSKGVA